MNGLFSYVQAALKFEALQRQQRIDAKKAADAVAAAAAAAAIKGQYP
jgi:hypothetical protein